MIWVEDKSASKTASFQFLASKHFLNDPGILLASCVVHLVTHTTGNTKENLYKVCQKQMKESVDNSYAHIMTMGCAQKPHSIGFGN
jgi:hypothetical protein